MFGLIYKDMNLSERKKAYNSNITYGAINEFVLDYLRDNTADNKKQLVQNELKNAIAYKIDDILENNIDSPITISKPTLNNEYSYLKANAFVRRLKGTQFVKTQIQENNENYDYIIDTNKKSVKLTKKGILKVEEEYEIHNYNNRLNKDIDFYINNALFVHNFTKKDIDYKVENGKINILNKNYMNLQQAIEAKEHLLITPENKIVAKISYRNYLAMYKKIDRLKSRKYNKKEIFINYNKILKDKIDIVYKKRKEILFSDNIKKDILKLINSLCTTTANNYFKNINLSKTKIELLQRFKILNNKNLNLLEFEKKLYNLTNAQYKKTEEIIGKYKLRNLEKEWFLKQIDEKWLKYQEKAEKINKEDYKETEYKLKVDKIFSDYIEEIRESAVKDLLFAKK